MITGHTWIHVYRRKHSFLKSSDENQLAIKAVTSVEAPLSSVNSGFILYMIPWVGWAKMWWGQIFTRNYTGENLSNFLKAGWAVICVEAASGSVNSILLKSLSRTVGWEQNGEGSNFHRRIYTSSNCKDNNVYES